MFGFLGSVDFNPNYAREWFPNRLPNKIYFDLIKYTFYIERNASKVKLVYCVLLQVKINEKCKTLCGDVANKCKCVLSSRNFYNVPNCTYLSIYVFIALTSLKHCIKAN